MRFIYSSLFYLLTPFILARLIWRGRKAPAYRLRWGERFALYGASKPVKVLWFHAVSVGEAEAAFPLVRRMQANFPAHPILVTTTTPTGSARVKAVLKETVLHVYLPYDLPDAVQRFLNQYQPVLAVVLETEIWPNLYHAVAQRGIPLAIVNARLSQRSASGYRYIASLTRQSLACVTGIAAQTPADAARFLSLGAKPSSVATLGNIKFDLELPEDAAFQGACLRKEYFGDRKVLIAASTHEGEEALLLRVFEQIRRRFADVLLVLAPRHPERFDAVAELCLASGFKVSRRSAKQAGADIFLLDTLGELRLFYAASDIAFVGGSLVPVGGHNVLEPALLGLPVLFGPHMFNFAEASQKIKQAGGGIQVDGADELLDSVVGLLEDAGKAEAMGAKARQFVESGRGALQRVTVFLTQLLQG